MRMHALSPEARTATARPHSRCSRLHAAATTTPVTAPPPPKLQSDVDCGGPCSPCVAGKACDRSSDCQSTVCTSNVCAAASCTDNVLNGAERDVDCGDGVCPACAIGKTCIAGFGCATGVCGGDSLCAAPTCTDNVKVRCGP